MVPHLGGSEIGKTLYPRLADTGNFQHAGRTTKTVPLEYIATFKEGYDKIICAAPDVAIRHREIWANIGNALRAAKDHFGTVIGGLEAGKKFEGATAREMFRVANESLGYLESLADAANQMDPLVDTFSRDMSETRHWFESYSHLLSSTNPANGNFNDVAGGEDPVVAILDQAAQRLIQTFYNPPIDWISHAHPDMTASGPQAPGPAGGGGTPSFGGGGPPSGLSRGGMGAPSMPSLAGLGTPDPSASTPTVPTDALKGLGDAAKGAGDAANSAGQQAQNAAGQAGNAANQALGQLPKGGHGGTGLPEGVLGLGPKGLTAANKTSGSGGRGGGAGGAGTRAPVVSKPSAQLTQASKAVTSAATSRAGVAGGGSPGAGAPVAGQRGGAGAGKEHKASKALRNTKHGQEVIGGTDAVVPVIGDESQENSPAKS